MRAVKYITTFALEYITRNWKSERIEGLNGSKKSHQNQTTSVSVNVWEFVGRLKIFYYFVLFKR